MFWQCINWIVLEYYFYWTVRSATELLCMHLIWAWYSTLFYPFTFLILVTYNWDLLLLIFYRYWWIKMIIFQDEKRLRLLRCCVYGIQRQARKLLWHISIERRLVEMCWDSYVCDRLAACMLVAAVVFDDIARSPPLDTKTLATFSNHGSHLSVRLESVAVDRECSQDDKHREPTGRGGRQGARATGPAADFWHSWRQGGRWSRWWSIERTQVEY